MAVGNRKPQDVSTILGFLLFTVRLDQKLRIEPYNALNTINFIDSLIRREGFVISNDGK
jgi:hypothetical protein